MKKEEFEKLQPEIQDYIHYMVSIGMINANNKDKILDRLSRTKVINDEELTAGGETTYDKNNSIIVKINKKYIEKESEQMHIDIDELMDINIFHELTHASSILDSELEEKTKMLFDSVDKKDNEYSFIFTHGYVLIHEFIAQSISQKIMEKKYGDPNRYPVKHGIFIYDENGYLPKEEAFSYEYDSGFVYYGELEKFALKFVESVYGDRDVKKLYSDHFNDKIFEVLLDKFKNRKNGMENLYNLFGHMSNILIGDYHQQGYLGTGKSIWSNIKSFKNSVNEFNRIADNEIEKQQIQL